VRSAQQDLGRRSENLQALLYGGKFDEAEPLARECVEQAPEEIYFLSQLEMALNGQGKVREADELRDRILKLWEQKYKEKWMAKGAPVDESSWARVIATSQEYHVIGTEYFIPRLIEGKKDDPLALYAFYKVIAFPKEGGGTSRILQLNKSKEEKNYFLEEYSQGSIVMAKTYGAGKPDIRAVVSDAVVYLNGHRK
jgi:hypothetical protein